MKQASSPSTNSRRIIVTAGLVFLLVTLVIGFVIGWFAGHYTNSGLTAPEFGDPTVSKKLLNEINPQNIREHLKKLTSEPHLVGSEGDRKVVEYIADFWKKIGLTDIRILTYKVLLSFPDRSNPNRIVMLDGQGNVRFTSQLAEKILRPDEDKPDVVPPFNAYSPPGNPRGQLVYVNYGRIEDFNLLNDSSVDLKGKICIARYGRIFRADKAKIGQTFGCIGMILYTDPIDYAVSGVNKVYPDSWWLPGTGVQRGTLKVSNGGLGDPLTPMYPAVDSAYRIPLEDAGLLTIPVQPIGYDDARILLQDLAGDEVPKDWRGALNITYRYGPGFTDTNWSVQMHISTNVSMAPARNVFGFIKGSIEPDRYVMIGNHHDAWVFGGVDPNSGTSTLLELARALTKQVQQGWKPRRSIMFCAWGAEEHGIIGTREWVEQFGNIVRDRTVAYINADSSVQGRFSFRARATPLLKSVLYEVAKQIPNPDPSEVDKGRKTVYDTWQLRYGSSNDTNVKPSIQLLGSGSDFAPFVTGVGVSCVDVRYDYNVTLGISSYPLYHSVYETFHLYETYIDPTFKFAGSVAQFSGELVRRLADYAVLPLNVGDLASSIHSFYANFDREFRTILINNGCEDGLEYLNRSVHRFSEFADLFEERVRESDKSSILITRQLNDQLMQLERAFIDQAGLPDRYLVKNVLYAPSAHNSYGATSFPGLVDSLFEIDKVGKAEVKVKRWRVVRQQLAALSFFIDVAANTLAEPTRFQ